MRLALNPTTGATELVSATTAGTFDRIRRREQYARGFTYGRRVADFGITEWTIRAARRESRAVLQSGARAYWLGFLRGARA